MEGWLPFAGVRRADAVIVGGGLTGLMTGSELTRAGMRVIVLDAHEPGSGASSLCTGAATLLCAEVYRTVVAAHGIEAAQQHVETLRLVLWKLQERLPALAPFRETEAYVYAPFQQDLPALEEQEQLFDSLGLPVKWAPDAGGCPFPVELSLMMTGQLLADASALMESLVKIIHSGGGQVIRAAKVVGLGEGRVHTQEGRVDAPVVILAAGKPPGDRRTRMLALLESRTMIGCRMTSAVPFHTCQQSVRSGDLCMSPIPGGAAISWCTGRSGTPLAASRAELFSRVVHSRLKDWEIGPAQYQPELWPIDGLPVIGSLPEYRGHVLCATGYAGHGLLGATLAAEVLARSILERSRPEDALYSPGRRLPSRISLRARGIVYRHRSASSVRRRSPVCTLCGSHMRYLIPGRRWECPVCGSAFGMLGRMINGPAVRDGSIRARQRPDL